jgi:hypothetical protein
VCLLPQMVSGFCLSGMNFGIDPELCNFVALVMKFGQRSLVEKNKQERVSMKLPLRCCKSL